MNQEVLSICAILERVPGNHGIALSQCAERYASQWRKVDQPSRERLLSGTAEERLETLGKFLAFYRVIRNLPRGAEEKLGVRRLESLLRIIDETSARTSTPVDPAAFIPSFAASISAVYSGTVTSLASKLGWAIWGSPIAIYDSLAKDALSIRTSDYVQFYDTWRRAYDINREELMHASSPHVPADWFAERVFDVFLWEVGNARRSGSANQNKPVRTTPSRVARVRPAPSPRFQPGTLYDGWSANSRAIAEALEPILTAGGASYYPVNIRNQIRVGWPKRRVLVILEGLQDRVRGRVVEREGKEFGDAVSMVFTGASLDSAGASWAAQAARYDSV